NLDRQDNRSAPRRLGHRPGCMPPDFFVPVCDVPSWHLFRLPKCKRRFSIYSLPFYGKNAGMRWIYLSPHLDDAALSAGGWIYDQVQAGNSVEIWNLMCGLPPTTELS